MNQTVLLFDGVCNLCNGLVKFVIKQDKSEKIKFASLQSDYGQKISDLYHLPKEDFKTLVLIEGDNYYLRSTAALKLFKTLGGFWKVFYVFIIVPVPIRDFVYNIVSKNRYKVFGKKETCMVPDKNLQNRFMSQ